MSAEDIRMSSSNFARKTALWLIWGLWYHTVAQAQYCLAGRSSAFEARANVPAEQGWLFSPSILSGISLGPNLLILIGLMQDKTSFCGCLPSYCLSNNTCKLACTKFLSWVQQAQSALMVLGGDKSSSSLWHLWVPQSGFCLWYRLEGTSGTMRILQPQVRGEFCLQNAGLLSCGITETVPAVLMGLPCTYHQHRTRNKTP